MTTEPPPGSRATGRPDGALKADRTRARILEIAQREASMSGIDALTIGGLARACDLSKSGLNAHFGSKTALQISVVDAVAERFAQEVALPVASFPAGRPQLIAVMDLWTAWSDHPDRPGGCQLIAASFDFDALGGPVRDRVAGWIGAWRDAIRAAVAAANRVEGTVRDPASTATIAFGLYTAQHVERFLLGDDDAMQRARAAWAAVVGH